MKTGILIFAVFGAMLLSSCEKKVDQTAEFEALDARTAELEGKITYLLGRVQSAALMPDSLDIFVNLQGDTTVISFEINPADAAESLAEIFGEYDGFLTVSAFPSMNQAAGVLDIPVTNAVADSNILTIQVQAAFLESKGDSFNAWMSINSTESESLFSTESFCLRPMTE